MVVGPSTCKRRNQFEGKIVSFCLKPVEFERPGGGGQQAFGCLIQKLNREVWARDVWESSPLIHTMDRTVAHGESVDGSGGQSHS